MSNDTIRHIRVSLLGFGLVSAFMTPVGRCVAQFPDITALMTADPPRLTVRPREVATGPRTEAAGEHPLDSVPDYLVYVPQSCVGTRRCPLFIFLPGAGYGSRQVTDWLHPVADKYGMILLAPSWDPDGSGNIGAFGKDPDKGKLDVALKEVLRRFAIDRDKIAISGRCSSGWDGMVLGIGNLDVFSRVASISGSVPINGMDPQNKTVEFFLDAGFPEFDGKLRAALQLRQDGHPVKVVVGFRSHEHQVEDYDFYGRWLQESWAMPNPAARPAPQVVADPLPVLTTEVLTQMTAFWTRFQQEPDSIRTTARRAHLREVVVPIGEERPSVWMVDVPALAAKYPSVAAALKTAGLTARQHEAYRIALLSARVTNSVKDEAGNVEATSALAKNMAFMDAHPDELAALEATNMWSTP